MFSIISQVHECEFLYSLPTFLPSDIPGLGRWLLVQKGVYVEKWVPEQLRRAARHSGTCLELFCKSLSVGPMIRFVLKPNPNPALMTSLVFFVCLLTD